MIKEEPIENVGLVRKSIIDSKFEKAYRPPVPIGTKKEYNGHMYVKTEDGWKSDSGSDIDPDKTSKKPKKPVKPVKKKPVKPEDVKTADYK